MARTTVEDCLKNIPNRFDLVLLSARRARQLAMGATPLVDRKEDKVPVVALREIALGLQDKFPHQETTQSHQHSDHESMS